MPLEISTRSEIEILSGDGPGNQKLGWIVEEFIGSSIYQVPPDLENFTGILKKITEQEALQVGMEVLVPGLLGGYHKLQVAESEGKLFVRSESLAGSLEFNSGKRGCWVCVGLINLEALRRLEITP